MRRTEHVFEYEIQHNFQDILDITLVGDQLDKLFERMIEPAVKKAKENDRIAIEIHHDELEKPLYISYVTKNRLDYTDFCNKIFQVTQSATTWLLDGKITVIVKIIENTSGGAGVQSMEESNANSRTFVTIHSKGHECGHLAIMLGVFMLNHDIRGKDKKRWNVLRQTDDNDVLRKLVFEYASGHGIDYNSKVDLDTINLYASTFDGIQIVVMKRYWDQSRKTVEKHFSTQPKPHTIYLELVEDSMNENHFNLITNIQGYLQCKFFCNLCFKSGDRRYHKCDVACKWCNKQPPCIETMDKINCKECNRSFKGKVCFNNHKSNNLCGIQVRCNKCLVDYPSNKKHQCMVSHCTRCGKDYQFGSHFCFLKPIESDKLIASDRKNRIMVYFDIESMMVTREGRTFHEPNLLVSMTICDECYVSDNMNTPLPMKERECSTCGIFIHIFKGNHCVKRFGDYLYQELQPMATVDKKKPMEVKVMAHNLRAYDGKFILRDLYARNFGSSPQLIMAGSKINMIDIDVIRFQDSYNLLPSALRTFPNAFGFNHRVVKGHFPYLFNTPERQGYIGKMPDIGFFGYDNMKPKEQEELLSWFTSVENETFDLQKDMEKYCISDCEILMITVEQFRREFKSMTSIDPISRNFTLPSICMEVFRSQMLEDDTIGITPIIPYGKKRRDSKIAKVYLDWIEESTKCTLTREQKLGNTYVDGYDEDSSTIFEFLGCFFHGCLKCFTDRSANHFDGDTMQEKYMKLQDRINYFEHMKNNINPQLTWTLMWECEFKQMVKSNEQLNMFHKERRMYWDKIESLGHLDLRDAYFGGRTNNIRFHCIITDKENECIKYQDFTSLYPSVLFRHPYPVGHPKVINSGFDYTIQSYFGFIKCKILAPNQLFFPILPSRINGKLMFVLCESCAFRKTSELCTHTDEERAFVGSFCTVELKEAVKYGYRIIEMYEVLHYENQSTSLFDGYIEMFMREKFHASGYPEWVKSEEDKHHFIEDLSRRQGIKLEKEKIMKNPIKRTISKLLLNTLYGKFGQRVNLARTELVRDYSKLWDIVSSGLFQVTGDTMVSEDKVLISYKMASEANCYEGKANVAIAAFVTSYARLELFRLIDKIESNHSGSVQYFDTDSVIYKYTNGDPIQECGDLLGQLTDELNGEKCFKACFLGPKNYSYELSKRDGSSETIVKAKGVRLTARTLETITLERMTEMAKNLCENNITVCDMVEQQRIGTTSRQQIVETIDFYKTYRAVSDKRMIRGNDTLPYGWKLC